MEKTSLIEDSSFEAIGIDGNRVRVYTKIEKKGNLYFWNMSYYYSLHDRAYIPSRSESTLESAQKHLKAYIVMLKSGVHLVPNFDY